MSNTSESQLSDEFKNDIKEKRKKNNFLGTFIAFLAIILVFGTVGIAGYQLVLGGNQVESKSASEKIESRPEEKAEVKEEEPAKTEAKVETKAETPAATTTVTETQYTVVSGDTWSSIANANGLTSARLMEYNGTSAEDLQIGQVIKIPKS